MSTPVTTGTSRALLFDSTLCVGCGACSMACKERNGLPRTAEHPLQDELSSKTYSTVKQHGTRFARHLCMHCAQPTCASVCPVGAIQKTKDGPVVYVENRCIGCRYCMQACPFMIPRYAWEEVKPRVHKCDLCADRLARGLATACAEACPTGANKFGDREALIAEAKARIAANPARYVDRIYGVEDVGGTAVLLLSGVPFDQLGYPTDLPRRPMPDLTWEIMSKVPRFAVTAGVFLGGVYWITKRRHDVAEAEGHGHHGGHAGEDHR